MTATSHSLAVSVCGRYEFSLIDALGVVLDLTFRVVHGGAIPG